MQLLPLLFAEAGPSKMGLLAAALLPTLAGLLAFWVVKKRDASDPLYKARLICLAPSVLGACYGGFLSYRMLTDYLYQQVNMIGFGMAALHYACLVVPILGIAGILVWNGMERNQSKYDF